MSTKPRFAHGIQAASFRAVAAYFFLGFFFSFLGRSPRAMPQVCHQFSLNAHVIRGSSRGCEDFSVCDFNNGDFNLFFPKTAATYNLAYRDTSDNYPEALALQVPLAVVDSRFSSAKVQNRRAI